MANLNDFEQDILLWLHAEAVWRWQASIYLLMDKALLKHALEEDKKELADMCSDYYGRLLAIWDERDALRTGLEIIAAKDEGRPGEIAREFLSSSRVKKGERVHKPRIKK
jgi:hypothetical protein